MEQNNYTSPDAASQSQPASSTTETNDTQSASFTDRAREIAGNTKEQLADVTSNVRDRAGHLKDSLADALSSGADKLRARGANSTDGDGQLAGATGSSSVAIQSDGRVTQVTNRVAGGMDATADWLRQADLDGLRTSVEQQVKEHPGRTLLIAVGVGYLLGKALRK
jgi:ElaB/YqjD/DUF883 family membrane-anchored ribosome-binding protein